MDYKLSTRSAEAYRGYLFYQYLSLDYDFLVDVREQEIQ